MIRGLGGRNRWAAARAVDVERRRLARDLHDGVVQELGWVRSALLRGASREEVLPAVDRAMAELRAAMAAATAGSDEPLAAALERAVAEISSRHEVAVRRVLDESVVVAPVLRDGLVRVAREAVTNAARHSGGTSVAVELVSGRLTVSDDGGGLDPAHGRAGGFGLTSMRERAEAVGAAVTITSAPGHGTRVEVTW